MLAAKLKQGRLPRYLAETESLESFWVLNYKERDSRRSVSIETYTLCSQHWPKALRCPSALWEHQLVLYRPDLMVQEKVLLFVNGGTRHLQPAEDNPEPHSLDFVRIAQESQSLVVDLQDVPNQHLSFEDQVARKGDSLFAYAWSRFLDHQAESLDWPLSLPMAKSVIKAMDAITEIMRKEYFLTLDQFVVTGLSKRGLATWLAALHDERIKAIIPIVIDTLNTKKIMNHIYQSYNKNWPPAFHDFVHEKIPARLATPEFEALMDIEDPLAYLKAKDSDFYKARLSIPKFIISASGDDFFTPDCLNLYLDDLPGETLVRFVPNQGHLIDMAVVEEAILSYYQILLRGDSFPKAKWKTTSAGILSEVVINEKPFLINLWEAVNKEARDFRLAAKVHYEDKVLVGSERDGLYYYPVQVGLPLCGWKAHFVEMHFQGKNAKTFIMTTPAFVVNS